MNFKVGKFSIGQVLVGKTRMNDNVLKYLFVSAIYKKLIFFPFFFSTFDISRLTQLFLLIDYNDVISLG